MMKVIKTDPARFMHKANKKTCIDAGKMADDIKDAIYKYSEQVPLALAIGVLDIVKKDLIDEST